MNTSVVRSRIPKNLVQKYVENNFQSMVQAPVQLNMLRDNPGASRRAKRVGRGIGSGKGKTCGRGHKGQKARQGGKAGRGPGFEGGQTPLYQRLPKRGFTNKFKVDMDPLNLGRLQYFIDMGRINPNETITLKTIQDSGIIGRFKHGVKLLGDGASQLKTPINIQVSRASQSAISAIEAAGGTVETVHFNRLALRAELKPEKFDVLPKRARPPPKLIQYYTSFDKRGYLCPELQLLRAKQDAPEIQIDTADMASVSPVTVHEN